MLKMFFLDQNCLCLAGNSVEILSVETSEVYLLTFLKSAVEALSEIAKTRLAIYCRGVSPKGKHYAETPKLELTSIEIQEFYRF
jgi:hypothetical protein